jgi:REP element-mobilizing transposase RayT
MSRPLRIEFPGAVYHVTSRGDRREAIYRDDRDRQAQFDVIAHAMQRFDAQLLAHCLMGNHFHLVLHTRAANLSRVMRHVNGVGDACQQVDREGGERRKERGDLTPYNLIVKTRSPPATRPLQ